ncbi:hypothetical protein D9613_007981 [Agrocybe pediades]|uniref:UDENN domain-containing protein n=1 Tax=Agrocybe pediades TaxID=84607 RepID=A0A8H4VK48_9AGAR|nr:hypothetical protein D9613_007981 [Agrocybe pediades]
MPSHVPAELNLDSPLHEEDISDLSPYLGLPSSTSSQASSSSVNSSLYAPSPRTDDDDTPGSFQTPTKYSFSHNPLASSVEPSPVPERSQQFESRAQTLPRGFQLGKAERAIRKEIKSLTVDTNSVEKMRRWILGIAVVEFDLDSGPVVDGIYPPMELSAAESENIAFCAFPDSLQFDQGSQTHSFRVKAREFKVTKDGYLYGFSHFIQKRDSSSKRGYQQRSVVILTQHQYPALFSALAGLLGPLFEQHGTPMLEAACHNIATWPNPTLGQTLELGFLGTVLQVEIPNSLEVQQVTETSSFNEKYDPRSHILATTAPFVPPPILLFEAAMANLWSIWECLVLCEPILVFGTSPAQTSQAVWWLRDLLRPIPLAGDFRPFFTMQDADHSQLVNKLPPKAGLLLGVTNPFFEKSCAHWPHVLSLGRRIPSSHSPKQLKSPGLGTHAGPSPGWKTKTHKRYISKDRVLLKQLENAVRGDDKARMDASLALRRHFCSRSTQLITPLARYLNTLIPSPSEVHHARKTSTMGNYQGLSSSASLGNVSMSSTSANFPTTISTPSLVSSNAPRSASPYIGGGDGKRNSNARRQPLRLKPFNSTHFFASLKAHGSVLPFKSTSKRTEFYERWLKSPAFGAWLAQQEQIVQSVLNDPPVPSPRIAVQS